MYIFKFYIIEIKRFTIENLLNLRSFSYLRTYTILVTIFFHRSTENAMIYLYHCLLIMYTWNKFQCINILYYFPRQLRNRIKIDEEICMYKKKDVRKEKKDDERRESADWLLYEHHSNQVTHYYVIVLHIYIIITHTHTRAHTHTHTHSRVNPAYRMQNSLENTFYATVLLNSKLGLNTNRAIATRPITNLRYRINYIVNGHVTGLLVT